MHEQKECGCDYHRNGLCHGDYHGSFPFSFSDGVCADEIIGIFRGERTMQDIHSLSLWHYVRQEITDGAWPYYEEPGSILHNSENAIRSFTMAPSGVASEIASYDISMYWTHGKEEKIPEYLIIKTKVTVKEQSCTITDRYRLHISDKNGYESWKWEHVDKK